MSTSPLDPQDVRAAAEAYRELGPEYSDAVVAAFIDRVDQAVAARVEARLAEERWRPPAVREGRRRLLKGVALGACAGALVAGVSISHAHAVVTHRMDFTKPGDFRHGKFELGPGDQRILKLPAPQPPPPAS
jgi:ferric-dicitrate binding protein FerR (iron transport regulator)